jgi:hypothetical protein
MQGSDGSVSVRKGNDRKGETDKVDEPARLADRFSADNRHVAFGHDIGDRRVEDDDARDAGLCQDRVGLEAQAEIAVGGKERRLGFFSSVS